MQDNKLIKRIAVAILLTAILMAAICPAALAFGAKIFSDSSVIYEYPYSGARTVSGYGGVTVDVVDWRNGWAMIQRGGRTAYIPVCDLNLTTPIPGWTNCAATIYNAYGKAAGTAPRGTKVYVIGYYDGYCRVVDSSGSKGGYIYMGNLSRTAPAAPAPAPTPTQTPAYSYSPGDYSGSAAIDYILYAAYSCLGKPYKSPSNPPHSFDCSGLVNTCFDLVGHDVGRTAQNQGYNDNYPKITSYSDLRPGDLLCFNTDTDDNDLSDHTAIYIGNGYFIHASSTAGKVQINEFTDYYLEHFSWARRIIG